MLFSLKGRTAIVTGAGSKRGIGRSIALALAEQGADVVICDLNLEGAAETAAEAAAKGVKTEAYQCNVISEKDIAEVVSKTIAKFGKIDILVNNAGITQPVKVLDMTEADWDRIVDVNMKSTFLFSKAVLPNMIANKYGRIVNMSSVSAKSGVEDEETQRKMTADIPCRRMGRPEDVAAAVCFLASGEAGYITGEEIDVNGGSHMD